MRESPPTSRRPRGAPKLPAVLVASSLLAAACGAASDTAAGDIDEAAQTSETEVTEAAGPAPPESAEAAPDSTAEAAVEEHLFPDLDTVKVSDGSTLNLATELAGGDKPVLFWFYAPH